MTYIEIWLLAISLAMDCFSVSITSGIILRRVLWKTFLTIAFFFGLFQGLMPVIGWFAASRFQHLIENYDHWIAFGVLFLLGARMIKESFKDEEEEHHFNPTRLPVILTLAVATSIDALAVGVTFALLPDVNITAAVSFIGVITLTLSAVGVYIGHLFGAKFKSKAELTGGIVLILMGAKILLEHLGVLDWFFGLFA